MLAAVFLPVAFLGGISGKLYREFAIALTVAVLISTFVALTLSPALCALLMKPEKKLNAFFTAFNRFIDKITDRYGLYVSQSIKHSGRSLALFAVICVMGYGILKNLPSGFVPQEDQGMLYADIQLQPGTSVNKTFAVVKRIERDLMQHPALDQVITLTGENISSGSGEENAYFQFMLKNYELRPDHSIEQVRDDIRDALLAYPEITSRVFQPPSLPGMGEKSGFSLEIQDRTGNNSLGLREVVKNFIEEANKLPQLEAVNTTLTADMPMLNLVVDREMVKTFGVALGDLNTMIKQLTGSSSASDFNMFGRTYRVKIQAEAEFRKRPEDLANFYVKSGTGALIPLSMLAKIEYGAGEGNINRHNLFTSASISGLPATGYSSGQAMEAIALLADQMLPQGYGYEWTGMSFQEIKSNADTGVAMLLAIVFVYLFLAALYESWTIPIPVLIIVPIALTGAWLFVFASGYDNNLFVQVSAVTLIGLAAKNSILIVEFASSLHSRGVAATEAALTSAKQRFRPILMTSFSFILGIMPLVLSDGPGAGARNSISTGTLGGMIAATTIGIILVPVFFVLIVSLSRRASSSSEPASNDNYQEEKA